MKKMLLVCLGMALLLLAVGCAGTARQTGELLAQDYRTMADQELQTYFYQLNDQIARVERQARGTSVGVGVGTGPVRIGVSQGVSRGTIAEELRERRNEVRGELSRRGLMP